jgi:PAS domain-containing protein
MWELLRPDRPVTIRVTNLLAIFIALFSLAIISLVAEYFMTRTLLADAHRRSQRLQMVMASGRLVGWDWDVTTGRDHWHGDLRTMFGIPSDQWSGQADEFFRYVHPDDRERVSQVVTDAWVNHKQYEAEFRVGAPRWSGSLGIRHGIVLLLEDWQARAHAGQLRGHYRAEVR